MRARAWTGSSPAPPRSGRIQPDQLRRLLLMIRPARPAFAEVPLADLFFIHTQRARGGSRYHWASGPRKPLAEASGMTLVITTDSACRITAVLTYY